MCLLGRWELLYVMDVELVILPVYFSRMTICHPRFLEQLKFKREG